MIGIESIGTFVPPGRISNLERCELFNCDEAFVRDKIGALQVSVSAAGQGAFELAVAAFDDLQRQRPVDPGVIDLIVVVTQTPGESIPHVAARLHGHLGAGPACACFDLGLGCSGFVYALGVVRALMEAQGLRNGLVFTSDPYSKIVPPDDRDTALLFGDAATVTLLTAQPRYRIGKTTMNTLGASWGDLALREGRLHMNGRGIFTFSAQRVPRDIEQMLALNGLGREDIDLFVVHQGSKFIVDTLRARLGLPPEKMPFSASDYGNTVSSSIPLVLADRIARADAPGRIVISGFGVGLSWASAVLTRADLRVP